MSVSEFDNGTDTIVEGGSLETVIARVKDALKQEGFGVRSAIDVVKALKATLGVYEALKVEPNFPLLLPYNVVVSAAFCMSSHSRDWRQCQSNAC